MLTKQAIDVSFAEGLDTKTDPKRVKVGNFLSLKNSIFDKGGLLQKRNGYQQLSELPDTTYTYLTTFNDNLTAIGQNISAYNNGNEQWLFKGNLQPLSLNTLAVIRNNLNQTSVDMVVAPNGIACAVYLETDGSTTTHKYVVFDATTGQNIVAPTLIPVAVGTAVGGMRVFVLNNYFVILFTNAISGTSYLTYFTVNSVTPTNVTSNVHISVYVPASTLAYDAYVVNNTLYIAYNTVTGGQSIEVTYLTSGFILATPVAFAGQIATMVSVTADMSNPAAPQIYVSYYDLASHTGFILSIDQNLNQLFAPVEIISSGTYLNITSAAQNGICNVFVEISNNYSFDSGIPTHFVLFNVIGSDGTIVEAFTPSVRSIGLASKAFIVNSQVYYLGVYQSQYQPTYFLINGTHSRQAAPVITAKLAYENGGGYLTLGLPNVTIKDTDQAWLPYLFKDLITAVNKDTNVLAGTQTAGIYSQTGINLAAFTISTVGLDTAEIGKDLHLSGGFLWMYDGYVAVEHNFFVWPDMDTANPTDAASWSTSGGSIHAQPDGSTNTNAYYYQVTYEWTDNQGNAFRSAPSIPIAVTTTGSGTSGSITLNIPTLRLTMKVANPVKIVIYRWSVGQPIYYQVTSISTPTLNDTTIDSITYVDTLADATILGNNIIYTNGGVVEDVNAPASNLLTLFDTRLWLVDAEDQNLLWFSKQVIEATPVEMSDLFTIYVPPTTGAQGSTGPITALSVMDDKLIIFKNNALYYINGSGPDNTGANNQYSQPIFITSTVGCSNQLSIVFMPNGLMFQSDKGIWLLDRGLNTTYIGAPVQDFTINARVESAQNIPGTNQVRFILNTGITLMYDYYYAQWGTFTGVPAISSCLFENLHTFINSLGQTYQEKIGTYIDGSNPVLMSFRTGPLRLGELQGYQRAYFFYLLGTYITPHKLQVSIFYDYSNDPSDYTIISPINYAANYGAGASSSPYGQGNPYGGVSTLEDWRIFLNRQRCMALSIQVDEVYDSTLGVPAGAGFTLSGLNMICGFKSPFRPNAAAITAGTS